MTEGPVRGEAVGQPVRVLVVDDERAVRYLVRTILSRLGFEVFEASGPSAADAWLASHNDHLDLLITDILMPGENGPELYRRLVRERPALRVLYMSGYGDDMVEGEHLVERGAAFLEKPFTPESLTRKVQEALASA